MPKAYFNITFYKNVYHPEHNMYEKDVVHFGVFEFNGTRYKSVSDGTDLRQVKKNYHATDLIFVAAHVYDV